MILCVSITPQKALKFTEIRENTFSEKIQRIHKKMHVCSEKGWIENVLAEC